MDVLLLSPANGLGWSGAYLNNTFLSAIPSADEYLLTGELELPSLHSSGCIIIGCCVDILLASNISSCSLILLLVLLLLLNDAQ